MNMSNKSRTSTKSYSQKKSQNDGNDSQVDETLNENIEEYSDDFLKSDASLVTENETLMNNTTNNLTKAKKTHNNSISSTKKTKEEQKQQERIQEDNENSESESETQENEDVPANIRGTWSTMDPDYLSSLLRIGFNTIISAIFVFVLISMIMAIQQDFANKREQAEGKILSERENCINNYQQYQQHCESPNIVPKMKEFCKNQTECISQNPSTIIKSTTMVVGLLTESLNEFVKDLSWKAIVFFFCLLFGLILFCGCAQRGNSRNFEKKMDKRLEEMNKKLERLEKLMQKSLNTNVKKAAKTNTKAKA